MVCAPTNEALPPEARLIAAGQGVSLVGASIQVVALGVMSWQAGGAAGVAAVVVARSLPVVVAPVLARAAGRTLAARRRAMLVVALWQALLTAVFALWALSSPPNVTALAAFAFTYGVGAAIDASVFPALVADVSGTRLASRAAGLIATSGAVGSIVGAVGGGLFSAWSPPAALGVNSLTFAAVFAAVYFWRPHPADTHVSTERYVAIPWRDHWREVLGKPGSRLRRCWWVNGTLAAANQNWALLPVFVAGSPLWLGTANAAIGFGALGASVAAVRAGARWQHLSLGAIIAAAGVAVATFGAVASVLPAIVLGAVVWGWGRARAGVAVTAILAIEVPPDKRPLAFGASQSLNQGTNLLGAASVAAFGVAAGAVCAGLFSLAAVIGKRADWWEK